MTRMENNVTVHSQYAASTQESLFRFLDQAFLHLGDAIHLAEDIVLSLSRNSYLTTLFNTEDVNQILERLYTETKGLPANDPMQMIQLIPSTFYTVIACNKETSPSCKNDVHTILTLVPTISEKSIYHAYQTVTLPVFHKGLVTNDWKRVKADNALVLTNDHHSMAVTPESLKCIKLPANIACDLCATRDVTFSDFEECLKHIRNGELPSERCLLEITREVNEESTHVGDNAWAYVDPTPGSITKKCPNKEYTRTPMKPNDVLTFNPECEYIINGGPFIQGQLPSNVHITSGTTPSIKTDTDSVTGSDTDIPNSVLLEHFEQNDVYYLIGLTATLALTVTAFGMYCCTKWPCRRYRMRLPQSSRRIPRARQAQIIPMNQMDNRYPSGELVPVISELNSALADYIQGR
jgi:hypothetical protein